MFYKSAFGLLIMDSIDWIRTILVFATIFSLQGFIWMNKRRRLPPGPKALPILGNLHIFGKNPYGDLFRLTKKHGPIMYMEFGFLPTIFVSSPESAEKILKTYDASFASRPHNEAFWHVCYEKTELAFTKYGTYWRNMRKLCSRELLRKFKINQFQSMRKEELGLLIESLKLAANSDHVAVDLSASIASLNANMSCRMIYGNKYMDKDFDDRGFKKVIDEFLDIAETPNLNEFFPFLAFLDLQGLTRRLKALSNLFDEFFDKIIDEHVSSKGQNQTKDFMDTMMDILRSGEAGFEFDHRHIKAVLLDIIAAVGTSGTITEWTLIELLRNPHAMKKLKKEIDEKVGVGRTVEEFDLEGLDYLNMVVKEALRLHPLSPLLFPHEAMEDCTVDGYHIKKNTRIIINTTFIGRDPKVWKDPERFFPERFAETNISIRGQDFRLLPFGSDFA